MHESRTFSLCHGTQKWAHVHPVPTDHPSEVSRTWLVVILHVWWIQLIGHDLKRPFCIRSLNWQCMSGHKPSQEVQGSVCRPPRQDCLEAQIWARVQMASIICKWETFGAIRTLPGVGGPARNLTKFLVTNNLIFTLTELENCSVERGFWILTRFCFLRNTSNALFICSHTQPALSLLTEHPAPVLCSLAPTWHMLKRCVSPLASENMASCSLSPAFSCLQLVYPTYCFIPRLFHSRREVKKEKREISRNLAKCQRALHTFPSHSAWDGKREREADRTQFIRHARYHAMGKDLVTASKHSA